MLAIRKSLAADINQEFMEIPRRRGETNVGWIERHVAPPEQTSLLLLGGTDSIHFRLRVAQSHARHDLTPSHWSHVGLLAPAGRKEPRHHLYEIPVDPPNGFGFLPVTNAVLETPLERYKDVTEFPNVAVVHVPVSLQSVMEQLDRFRGQRAVLDAVELLVLWLSYVWGVGRAGNPLVEGHGLPSAAMVEFIVGAANFELTPGLASRSSCPEAIWQSARWWHTYYARETPGDSREPAAAERVLRGAWTASHWLPDNRTPANDRS